MTEESDPIRSDDDLIMISALQHYSYCPRQYALIHQEQTFDENVYTLRGGPCTSRWTSRSMRWRRV